MISASRSGRRLRDQLVGARAASISPRHAFSRRSRTSRRVGHAAQVNRRGVRRRFGDPKPRQSVARRASGRARHVGALLTGGPAAVLARYTRSGLEVALVVAAHAEAPEEVDQPGRGAGAGERRERGGAEGVEVVGDQQHDADQAQASPGIHQRSSVTGRLAGSRSVACGAVDTARRADRHVAEPNRQSPASSVLMHERQLVPALGDRASSCPLSRRRAVATRRPPRRGSRAPWRAPRARPRTARPRSGPRGGASGRSARA